MRPVLLALLWLMAAPTIAGTAFRCVDRQGRVSYQDHPCPAGQRQRILALPATGAAQRAPAATPWREPAARPAPAATTPAAPAPRPVPLPQLYACVRATDGTTYLSRTGDPAPYQVPYGMLDGGQSLSDSYGATRGRAGGSAPEGNRGRVTGAMIGSDYVLVQDACRALEPDETCQALRDDYEANEHRLGQAFRSQRPPLERRKAELEAQLANCP